MFGFPKADRNVITQYKRNYLRAVIFQIKFPENDIILTKKELISNIFSELFPRTQDSVQKGVKISFDAKHTPIMNPTTETNEGFELRSNDGHRLLSFFSDGITYTVNGPEYINFSKLWEKVEMLNKILEECKIEAFNRVAVRKLNLIEYIIPDEQVILPIEISGLVLNKELISNFSYFPSLENVQQNIHNVNYVKGDYKLNLRYGSLVPKMDNKEGQILIDIDLFNTGNISKTDLTEEANKINAEIFNVFNWAVSENAIQQLMS